MSDEIQIGDIYKQKPHKKQLPFQIKLRYRVTKLESKHITFEVVNDSVCNYRCTFNKFKKYLVKA